MSKKQRGSTIIEIIIATAVVGMVMTAVAAVLVVSVRNSARGKYSVLATSRAQEALEVFRRERVLLGWEKFSSIVSADRYCMNNLPADSTAFQSMSEGMCGETTVIAGTDYTREALIDLGTTNQIRVEITVKWTDGDSTRQESVVQEFRKYEEN